MSKRIHIWTKGKRTVASLLLATTMLLTVAPGVHAEDSQSQANAVATTQASTEETVTPNIVRYEGRSRENVAEAVAKEQFSDSNKVIIVNREKFPDAISATNISQGKYPVLYTREGSVSDSTLELLESMTLDEIYVLGGTLSVNDSVVEQLEAATNVEVTRVAGRSRYDANVSAVEENFTQANHAVIASGEVYSDALYGVSYANTIDAPVVLTNTNRLEASTVELLKGLGIEGVTIIGGPLTVSEAVEDQLKELGIGHTRISGRNRYIGSAEVAKEAYDNPENVVVASGEVFSDALVSAPIAQKLDAPILLVRKNRMEEVVEKYLSDNMVDIKNIYIQGGPLTILPALEERIGALTSYEKTTNIVSETRDTEKYTTIEKEDDTLAEGETEVITPGQNGYRVIRFEVTYIDGVEVSRVEIDREDVDPVPEEIRVGTQVTEVKEENIIEDVDFDTEEIFNFNAVVGENEIVKEGIIGESNNIYDVTYVNGVETERELIDSEVITKPVNEVVSVGVLPEDLSESQKAPNGMTIQIDDITFTEGETYNTFIVEYTETNNTEGRVDQDTFKLYLTNGEAHPQTGFFNTLMPGESTSRTFTVRLLKAETPQTLEYGDVFFNEEPSSENPIWKFAPQVLEK